MKQDLMGKCNIKTSNLAWFYNQDVLDLWGKKYYLYTIFRNGDKLFCTKDDWDDDIVVRKPRKEV